MNIGQFVKHMMLNSSKSNSEILKLVLERFEGAKTTSASVAWYRADLRKKGLISKGPGKNHLEISQEELEALCE